MSVLDELHPKVLSDENGQKIAIQIKYELFQRIVEELEDAEDRAAIDEHMKNPDCIPFEEACREYDIA